MKYSVLGFNQAKLLETDLDLTDLMILNYIVQINAVPKMQYYLDEDDTFLVWISHSKLMSDLPILKISEGTLKNRLSRLKQFGYIKSVTVADKGGRGTRTYYGLTELTTSLIYDVENTTTSRKNDVVTRPRHVKMTSDNILNTDNTLKDNISKDILHSTEEKPKKLSMYEKCVRLIEEYTDNQELRDLLVEYLKMRLSMKDKPLYGSNQFKGILNKLNTIGGDPFEIVNYCIERGYASFYAPTTYSKREDRTKFGETSEVVSKSLTKEELNNGYFTGNVY